MGWLVKWTDSSWSAIRNSYIFELFFPLLFRRETLSRKINSCWEVFCVKQCLLLSLVSITAVPYLNSQQQRMQKSKRMGSDFGWAEELSLLRLCGNILSSIQNITFQLSLLGPWIHGNHRHMEHACQKQTCDLFLNRQGSSQPCVYMAKRWEGVVPQEECVSAPCLSLCYSAERTGVTGVEKRVCAPSLPSAVFALSSIIQ